MTDSVITKKQTIDLQPVEYVEQGTRYRFTAEIRFDDECGNGHNSFGITGTLLQQSKNGKWVWVAGGCLHDEFARHYPEKAHLLKWHLCSTDGPMHYLANTVYLASDRDHYGKRKGEPSHFENAVSFGGCQFKHRLKASFAKFLQDDASGYDFEVIQVPHRDQSNPGKHQFDPKYTFGGYGKEWHECPFDSEQDALDFLHDLQRCNPQFHKIPVAWSQGKEPELDAARRAAIWPDATAEQLTDKTALQARLPDLMAEFRRDIQALGFRW